MQRKKPSMPPRDNDDDESRTVVPPSGLVRRGAYSHSHGKVAMKTAYYHPAMKRSMSVSTSDESGEEIDQNESVRVKSRASHESMLSADERNNSESEDETSDEVNKDKESSAESDDDHPERAVKPDDSDDDPEEEEKEVKPPVKQPPGTPEGLKLAMMSSGEREALLRQELRIPPGKIKYGGKRKIITLTPSRPFSNFNTGGCVENPVYVDYKYTNHLDRPDDTVYYRHRYPNRHPSLTKYMHSMGGNSSSGLRRMKLQPKKMQKSEPKPQTEQDPGQEVKQDPPQGPKRAPDQKGQPAQLDKKPNEKLDQNPDQEPAQIDQNVGEEPATKRMKESE